MGAAYKLLPPVGNARLEFPHFPTRMQAFIFRNWEIVPKERIAQCLVCSVQDVEKQAYKMGLPPQKNTDIWLTRGYISIIRLNWHLLPYEQLLELLGWDEEKFAIVLKDEDFLKTKLIGYNANDTKLMCERITYRELTEAEEQKTESIKKLLQDIVPVVPDKKEPFDFFHSKKKSYSKSNATPMHITVDSSWGVVDETGDRTSGKIIGRYKHDFEETWGITLDGKDNHIVFRLFEEKKAEEYHEIRINEQCIEVTAADSTGILRALVHLEDMANAAGSFSFKKCHLKRTAKFKTRLIYSFCGLYNDAADTDSRIWCPDGLLESYSKVGVNAIWIQGILYRLAHFPFEPSLSVGMEERIANINDFIARCKEYGIKVFLYFNEPRAMEEPFFEKHPDIKGAKIRTVRCLCSSSDKVKHYVSEAVESVCRAIPELGGIFTISSSENKNNCRCWTMDEPCPICSQRSLSDVASEINNLVIDAAHRVNPELKVIIWDWGWRREGLMSGEDVEAFIKNLSPGAIVMSGRERGIPIEKGGIKGEIEDYTLCVTGVGEMAKDAWRWARRAGLETAAKLQINNTWECSTIPYLPLFRTVETIVADVEKEGVEHIMLSWTLGGAPSPNIKVISAKFFDTEGDGEVQDVYHFLYGSDAPVVKKATDKFCDALSEFPFSHRGVYAGPANGGVANLLFAHATGLEATMTCYSYDDLESWRQQYPEEIFEKQYEKMTSLWGEGLAFIRDVQDEELKNMATAVYIQLQSSENQIKFIRARNAGDHERMAQLAKAEIPLAAQLHALMDQYPQIGFEAANHYYYTKSMLKEKILNCKYLYDTYHTKDTQPKEVGEQR